MRHKIAFLLGLLVGAALTEAFARRRGSKETRDPRTEELRRRLAQQRARPTEQAPVPSGPEVPSSSTAPSEAPTAAGAASTDGRHLAADRQRIYDQGRAAVEEMRRSSEPTE